MVPVKNLESLKHTVLNKSLLKEASAKFGFEGCYLFTTEHAKADYLIETRFFNPSIGIDDTRRREQQPPHWQVTLKSFGFIQKDADYRILQGEYVNQPSTIQVKVVSDGIWISGSSVIVMKGELYL